VQKEAILAFLWQHSSHLILLIATCRSTRTERECILAFSERHVTGHMLSNFASQFYLGWVRGKVKRRLLISNVSEGNITVSRAKCGPRAADWAGLLYNIMLKYTSHSMLFIPPLHVCSWYWGIPTQNILQSGSQSLLSDRDGRAHFVVCAKIVLTLLSGISQR
jgi:hypothetical protein